MKNNKPILRSEILFEAYPNTRDDGVNPTNKLLGTDANGFVKMYSVPAGVTSTSDLINDGADNTSTYVEHDELGLEAVDQGNGLGWVLGGRDNTRYVNVGKDSIDMTTIASATENDWGVSAPESFAIGNDVKVQQGSGYGGHVVIGGSNTILGGWYNNIIIGAWNTITSGWTSIAMGTANRVATSDNRAGSVTIGHNNDITGHQAAGIGSGLIVKSKGVFVAGLANTDYSYLNPMLIVGGGTTSDSAGSSGGHGGAVTRKDVFVVLQTGEILAPNLTTALIDADTTEKVLITKEHSTFKYVPYLGATKNVDLGAHRLATTDLVVRGSGVSGKIALSRAGASVSATNGHMNLQATTNWKMHFVDNDAGDNRHFSFDYSNLTIDQETILTIPDKNGTIALLSDISAGTGNFVPYTGATTNVDLNAKTLSNVSTYNGIPINIRAGTSISIGANSGTNNTGTYSVFQGSYSGHSNTGDHTIFSGYNSGNSNTGDRVIGLGFGAMQYNGFGRAVGIGASAGTFNEGGTVLIGSNAGLLNKGSATLIGYNSGQLSYGEDVLGVGRSTLINNENDNNTALGEYAMSAFPEDTANNLLVDFSNINNPLPNQITITAHGFGAAGVRKHFVYKGSTGTPIAGIPVGLLGEASLNFEVVDVNTIELLGDTMSTEGTGIHTFTPQFAYSNSTALGYNSQPTKSNQVTLGDANVDEVRMGNGDLIYPAPAAPTASLQAVTEAGNTTTLNIGVASVNDLKLFAQTGVDVDNIGIGTGALNLNSASNVVAIGSNALGNNTGSSAVGIGFYALYNNTSSYAVGVGDRALENNTGSNSAGIGRFALQNNTGVNSYGLGYQALQSNIGDSTIGVGFEALSKNTGSNSVGVGGSTLRYNQGGNNTSIGYASSKTFQEDTANAKNVVDASTDVDFANNQITINSHGFGPNGSYVSLKYTTTGTPINWFSNAYIYQFQIIDANTIESLVNIYSTGTDTHTFTPQFVYDNVTVLGANAESTKSNQVTLGDANVDEVRMGNGDVIYDSNDKRSTRVDMGTGTAIDWAVGDTFVHDTLTAGLTLTDSNLPQGTRTKTITLDLDGDFAITPPAYWVWKGGEYDGTVMNRFVIECVNGTAASEIVYYTIIPNA